MTASCEHFDADPGIDPALRVCEPCVAMDATWHHLRQCLACGQTSCCDLSPNRHATAHFNATGHPMIRSAEPGDRWSWCYVDDLLFEDVGSMLGSVR